MCQEERCKYVELIKYPKNKKITHYYIDENGEFKPFYCEMWIDGCNRPLVKKNFTKHEMSNDNNLRF